MSLGGERLTVWLGKNYKTPANKSQWICGLCRVKRWKKTRRYWWNVCVNYVYAVLNADWRDRAADREMEKERAREMDYHRNNEISNTSPYVCVDKSGALKDLTVDKKISFRVWLSAGVSARRAQHVLPIVNVYRLQNQM